MNGIFSNIPKLWNFKCLILNKWDHMSETWQRKPGLLDISMCNSCQLRDNYSMYWLALLVLWWSWVSILENLVRPKLLMMFPSIEFNPYFWRFPDVLFILDNKTVTSLLPREGKKWGGQNHIAQTAYLWHNFSLIFWPVVAKSWTCMKHVHYF